MIKKNEKHLQSNGLADLQTTTKAGFTLAEVLITLGIIGVVAAMTIPTLMVDINTRQWSTAADVFEKKLNESLKTMNTQQTIAGHTTTLSFVEELAKHFKINRICKNDELQNCFSETVYWGAGEATPEEVDMTTIKQASHFGLDYGTELIGVQFANGVAGLVAYNPACSGDPYSNQFNGSACISMLYDTSGDKNPNTNGKDIGNYGVINRLGNSGCAIEVGGTCYTAPVIADALKYEDCITQKDTLGLQYCLGDNDYFAGAVAACGGINKLPTASQIADIANYLYDTTSITSNSLNEDVHMNSEKLTSLGFTYNSYDGGYFSIWSNIEASQGDAYSRTFQPNRTIWREYDDGYARTYNNFYTVCISN